MAEDAAEIVAVVRDVVAGVMEALDALLAPVVREPRLPIRLPQPLTRICRHLSLRPLRRPEAHADSPSSKVPQAAPAKP